MGCCMERTPEPNTEVPVTGTQYTFKIMQDRTGQSALATDNGEDSGEQKGAPWLRLETSNSLEDKPGSIAVRMVGAEAGKDLVKLEVTNEVEIKKLEDKTKTSDWGSVLGDTKVKVAWECSRDVKITVGEKSGTLKAHYLGHAEAKKDVDYDIDGQNVEYKQEAEVKELKLEIMLDGKTVAVEIDKLESGNWNVEFKAEGWFTARYESFTFGRDLVHVTVEKGGEPVSGCAIGYLIAQWLHPKRVEDNAAQLAMDILSKKTSWF